jgi:branched-chain amino acid transport system permease protein
MPWSKIIGAAVWCGLLALPLTGGLAALKIGAAVALGGAAVVALQAAAARPGGLALAGRITTAASRFALDTPAAQRRLGGGLLALALVLPLTLNSYYVDILTQVGIYIVLALGLNIVVGLAGLLDLGYAAFYALGAYAYALLSVKLGLPFWLGLPVGAAVAAAFGMVLGLVTLRLRGDYLAIVTLGFIQIVNLVLKNWDEVTNGPNGILGIGRPAIGPFVFSRPIHFYYLILAIVLVTIFALARLSRSRVGRAWVAIREDEVAAAASGVDTTRYKVLAFALGAAWAGLAGVVFAGKFGFISPESFTFFESVFILAMVVLGGMGSIPGVILGAVVLVVVPELLRGVSDYRMLIFGAALVIMMVFRPQGLIPNPQRRFELKPPSAAPSK